MSLPPESMMRMASFLAFALCAASSAPAAPVDFAHDVAPIIKAHCAKCHTQGKHEGDISLESRSAILKSGAAVAGQAAESALIERVTSTDPDARMPPQGEPLTAAEVATLRNWINEGLPWEDGFTFDQRRPAASLAPRTPELPPARDGRNHPIDRIVDGYLARHDQPILPVVDDARFIRRASLDLVGLLPAPEDVDEFVAERSPDKHARLIDRLLANTTGYADHWLTFWNDLLRNDYVGTGYVDGGRKQISGWLYASLAANKPYDQFVRELISPADAAAGFIGGIQWRGRVNASQATEVQFAQNVSQVFLGINMKCASCHDSFVDSWKLSDAYGLAAIVASTPIEIHRCDVPIGKLAEPMFIFPELGAIDPKQSRADRLKRTAELMTDPRNGRLARTLVNRLWQRMMGRGIVHPVDIMDEPAWSQDLLDWLAADFVAHGYDLKHALRRIATSEAYRAACVLLEEEPGAEFVYRGPLPRRLSAEQFIDAVWTITGTPPPKAVLAPPERGSEPVRASLVISDLLMRALGRPNREQVVSVRPDQLATLQALDLSNGKILAELLKNGAARTLKARPDASPAALAERLFRQTLARKPTPGELSIMIGLIGTPPGEAGLADATWSVLMLPEFQFVE